ncbi:hypothetical protein [Erwinia sp. SLM-02]|uniref:hypothetical protein n=1 Tax=Erwinia sp. SLM-02 TaxID=3020057 RepID=UPI0028D7AC45|nr:hypothetical protein [uncultured Erwinia sp.]
MKLYTRRWLSALLIAASATLHAGSDSQDDGCHDDRSMASDRARQGEQPSAPHLSKSDLKAIAVYLKRLVSQAPPAAPPPKEKSDGVGI